MTVEQLIEEYQKQMGAAITQANQYSARGLTELAGNCSIIAQVYEEVIKDLKETKHAT